MKFHYKKSIGVDYGKQGYIFFLMRRYAKLDKQTQKMLRDTCREAAGQYDEALWALLTRDEHYESVCRRFYLSAPTLFRCERRFYQKLAGKL